MMAVGSGFVMMQGEITHRHPIQSISWNTNLALLLLHIVAVGFFSYHYSHIGENIAVLICTLESFIN